MPYCPTCRLEYLPHVRRCPDCDQPLVDHLPPPPQPPPAPPSDAGLVHLCTVPDPTEAEIVKAALAEASIPALIRRHGPLTGELAVVADGATHDYAIILVPRHLRAQARQLLNEIRSGPVEWPEGMEPEE
jgi:hypothetical protein